MAQNNNKVSNSFNNDGLRERLSFVTLFIHMASGELEELLQNAPVGICAEYARLWDKYSKLPIGKVFQRPNFEAYEAFNRGLVKKSKTIN